MGLTPQPSGLFSKPPIDASQYKQGAEPARSSPALGKIQDRLTQKGLTPDICRNLMMVWRELKESWAIQRRLKRRSDCAGLPTGYAARFCLTTRGRERCFSFICSVETTVPPRWASCRRSCWIACKRSCLRP
jgi:hypothetical protein